MAFGFVFNDEADALPAGKLFGAGLLGVEVIEAGFARQNFPSFGQFQSFGI